MTQYEKDLAALEQDGYTLQFVKDQNPELFDLMLDDNIDIIEDYIKIPIEELSSHVQLYLKLK